MILNNLNIDETKIVLECLKASISGPFISNDIFPTLVGCEKYEVEILVSKWDTINQEDEGVFTIINNVLNNLTYSTAVSKDVWYKYVSVSRKEAAKLYYKWLGKEPPTFKWDGEIKGAISRNAKSFWEKLSTKRQNESLSNIRCFSCDQNTSITNYEGGLNIDNNLSILGRCIRCGKPIEIIIDTKKWVRVCP